MVYLTRKDDNEFRRRYQERFAPVDDVSHVFGICTHSVFFWAMDGWMEFIDETFHGWVTGTIEAALSALVRFVYENRAEHYYNNGVDKGRKLMEQVSKVIDWANNTIRDAVEDMKNRIDQEIISPVRNKVDNELMPQLRNAETRINTLSSDVSRALGEVDTMRSNIAGFDGKIEGFDSKLSSFDSKIKDFDSNLSSLDSRIRNSENTLNSLNTKISDLVDKVDAVDKTLSNHKDLLDKLKTRVAHLEGREPEEEEKPFFPIPKFLEG